MKKADVVIGQHYVAKVSGQLTVVRIDCPCPYSRGWIATNIRTGREVHIKSAAKLRRKATTADLHR